MTALAAWWSKWRLRYICEKQTPLRPSDPIPYLPTTSGAVKFTALCNAGFSLIAAFDFADSPLLVSDLIELDVMLAGVAAEQGAKP